MKKLFLFFAFMAIASYCYAGIISYDDIISANDVTIAWLNGQKNTVYQTVNGSIEGINIARDTISDDNLVPAIKMQNWYDESLGDWTYTGHLGVTDATLTSDISAGTSYVNGHRITTSSTSKTYNATKDTWVYIDVNGAFQYVETAVGATQPTSPANSLLLFKATTSGVAITTITDLRQLTPPSLRIYLNYRQGCIVSYDTAATVKINPGEIDLGTGSSAGRRRNTTALTLNWTDLDTGAESASTYYYVFAYPDANNAGNFLGKISVNSTDATGITNERLLGWFWNDESSNISKDSTGCYKGDGSGSPNILMNQVSGDIAVTSLTDIDLPGLGLRFYSSGRPMKFSINGSGIVTSAVTIMNTKFEIDGNNLPNSEKKAGGAAPGYEQYFANEYVFTPSEGVHLIKAKIRMEGTSALTLKNRTLIAEEY